MEKEGRESVFLRSSVRADTYIFGWKTNLTAQHVFPPFAALKICKMRKQRPSSLAASALASAALAVFVLASVLSLSVLVYRSGGEEDQNDRNRRSSNLRDEYLYRNRIHRVLWAKRPSEKSAYLTPEESSALSDTFIAVKTTGRFHRSRLGVVLKTWFNLAKEQVN